MYFIKQSVNQSSKKCSEEIIGKRISTTKGDCRKIPQNYFSTMARRECHYEVLGIPRQADTCQIKSAFIEKTKLYHPDRRPSDSSAHDRFVRISEAYSILSRNETRDSYDFRMGYKIDQHCDYRRSMDSQNYSRPPEPFTPGDFRDYRYTGRPSSPYGAYQGSKRRPPTTEEESSAGHDVIYGMMMGTAVIYTLGISGLIFLIALKSLFFSRRRRPYLADDFQTSPGLVRQWNQIRKAMRD